MIPGYQKDNQFEIMTNSPPRGGMVSLPWFDQGKKKNESPWW